MTPNRAASVTRQAIRARVKRARAAKEKALAASVQPKAFLDGWRSGFDSCAEDMIKFIFGMPERAKKRKGGL